MPKSGRDPHAIMHPSLSTVATVLNLSVLGIDANENPEQWQADIVIHSATELLQWIASYYVEAASQSSLTEQLLPV